MDSLKVHFLDEVLLFLFRTVNLVLVGFGIALLVFGMYFGWETGLSMLEALPLLSGFCVSVLSISCLLLPLTSQFMFVYGVLVKISIVVVLVNGVLFVWFKQHVLIWSGVPLERVEDEQHRIKGVGIAVLVVWLLLVAGLLLSKLVLTREMEMLARGGQVQRKSGIVYGSLGDVYEEGQSYTFGDDSSSYQDDASPFVHRENKEMLALNNQSLDNSVFDHENIDDEKELRSNYARLYQKYNLA